MHEAAADRQAQARAFGAALRVADLLERLEQLADRFRRHADAGVNHLEPNQIHVPRLLLTAAQRRDAQQHFPRFGEFDRVAEQIQQHLAQPLFIGHHAVRQRRRRLQFKEQIFLLRPHADNARDAVQKAAEMDVAQHEV